MECVFSFLYNFIVERNRSVFNMQYDVPEMYKAMIKASTETTVRRNGK